MTASDLDLSQPLATLLKAATTKAHERAETSPGAKLLLSGQLPKRQYIQFLMMLWHVYNTFERALEQHSAHPTLEPTYNPTLLGRTASLTADISYLLQVPPSTWQSHPLHATFLSDMPTQLRIYVDRINLIANSPDPSALLAHSYVRYLGDLSGGQFIRRVIVKAYGLDEASELGVEFYEFKELGGARKATQGDMKKIKDWFREGMNKGGERNDNVKAAVVNEANLAFELNTGLFEAIQVFASEEKALTQQAQEKETTNRASLEISGSRTEKTYSLASVAAFIAATCLAHFVLVITGFTGAKGNQKLLALEHWFTTLFSGSPSVE
ncbi:heme oxygenase 1 [Macrolepiota fuliginosa MF-IS2]|uniref:Heme oxygenase 1 n=1 Tax=Macrolepiota fuliginosa MF-IS2 TaxID=1400762 RepID=A0A9P5XNX4_9AGAR|nr:heme oxygenase 1 [Macrolepiota fuliginosa MF-IS2]